jgi:hypothetical protein
MKDESDKPFILRCDHAFYWRISGFSDVIGLRAPIPSLGQRKSNCQAMVPGIVLPRNPNSDARGRGA